MATVEEGRWAELGPEMVVVPAAMAVDNGVWFRVWQGVRGLAVCAAAGAARVYVLCEPASHYYKVMTRSEWMPCLVGERI